MLPGLIATSCRRLASRTRGGAARCTRPNLARWVASSHPQTGADCRHRHHRPHYSFDSIGTRLVDIATDRADDVAVVSPRCTRVTYGTLLAHADALADSMREIRTICHCGRKATMVIRKDGAGNVMTTGEQVQIGGNETYLSLCRRHWRESFEGRSDESER